MKKIHLKHVVLRLNLKMKLTNVVWWKKKKSGSLVAWVFSLARMAASIARLVRHCYV